jgi:hypothetical protein
MSTESTFHRALLKLISELFDGPPGSEAYILNPGDPGLLRQLETIDATTASNRPMPGKTTIAAHVDHVCYGLELLNRWVEGEENPWGDADWTASWKRGVVSDQQWRALRDKLKDQSSRWSRAVAAKTDWDDISAAGAISSAAHTAYHLGAIRQILAGAAR